MVRENVGEGVDWGGVHGVGAKYLVGCLCVGRTSRDINVFG
jgi:hypothetical protein